MFAPLPCTLDVLPLPHRKRDLESSEDRDVMRLGEFVVSRSLHLGILIDDDGRQCALVNDEGRLVPREQWETWLMEGTALGQFPNQVPATLPEGEAFFDTDALLTLAVVLSEMSRSDAQLSEHLWVG